jgi:hypothetical protein
MKNMKEFDNILNECIERVLNGESVEACLKAFPQHAAELEPLLRTALDTHKAANIVPRPEFRQRAGYEFQAAVRDMKPSRGGFPRWQLRWVTAVSVVLVVLLAGSGTIAASASSLPDESLYGVKLFTEEVRLALTPSDTGKAELHAEFADTRVEEIIKMADKGNVEQVVKATGRMNNNLAAVAKLIKPAGDASTTEENAPQALMKGLSANVTAAAAPAPDTGSVSPAATRIPAPVAVASPTPPVKPTPALTPNTGTKAPSTAVKATPAPFTQSARSVTSNVTKPSAVQTNDEKTKVSSQAQLNTTVLKQAEKNTKDLQEALKRAPDSVKPALEKAIKDAEKGYGEALENTEKNSENSNEKNRE